MVPALKRADDVNSPNAMSAAPQTIIYATQPNAYFDDHAADIKKFADGFFFTIGGWDGVTKLDPAWIEKARQNLTALRRAGITVHVIDA